MSGLFKALSPEEITAFQKWARENYRPFNSINGVWHPIVQRECAQMNEEELSNLQFCQEREEFLKTRMQDNKSDLL